MNCWPSGSCTPKRNALPPLALCTRPQLWKRTAVCRPRDKPSLCLPLFLSLCLPLSHSLPPSLPPSPSHLLILNLLMFSLHTHTDTRLRRPSDALLSYLFCADKSLPTQTQQWMTCVSSPSPDSESPDGGQTTPSNCPLCQREQLILGVVIPAMTLIAILEVTIAATLCSIVPSFLLLIHVRGFKAKQGQALNIRSISHIVCLLASHRCTQNW